MSFTVDQFASDDYAPETIKKRLQEVCPNKKIDMMSIDELDKSIHTAFSIIGYEPNNLEKSIGYAFENVRTDNLWDYIYTVWRCDYGLV